MQFLRSTKSKWDVKIKLIYMQDHSVIFLQSQIPRSDLIIPIVQWQIKKHLRTFYSALWDQAFHYRPQNRWNIICTLQCENIPFSHWVLLLYYHYTPYYYTLTSSSYTLTSSKKKKKDSLYSLWKNKTDHYAF